MGGGTTLVEVTPNKWKVRDSHISIESESLPEYTHVRVIISNYDDFPLIRTWILNTNGNSHRKIRIWTGARSNR